MKRLLMTLVLLTTLGAFAEEELVRNPFWPQDYEGMRYPITLVPRNKPEPTEPTNVVAKVIQRRQTAEEINAQSRREEERAREKLWADARKSLKFGATMGFSDAAGAKMAITINDNIYTAGDLISIDFEGNRFTWRIESVSADSKLKLKRIHYRKNENKQ